MPFVRSLATQDGCLPSCSSIRRPMIHFTDTWVIIGADSSPAGRNYSRERGEEKLYKDSKKEKIYEAQKDNCDKDMTPG